MNKKIGLFWLRDDFRIARNDGLAEATYNHEKVVVFYLYKEQIYREQQAQKWWLPRSGQAAGCCGYVRGPSYRTRLCHNQATASQKHPPANLSNGG